MRIALIFVCLVTLFVELTDPTTAFVRMPVPSVAQTQALKVKTQAASSQKSNRMPASATRRSDGWAPSHFATAMVPQENQVPLLFLVRAQIRAEDFVHWYPRPIEIPPLA